MLLNENTNKYCDSLKAAFHAKLDTTRPLNEDKIQLPSHLEQIFTFSPVLLDGNPCGVHLKFIRTVKQK